MKTFPYVFFVFALVFSCSFAGAQDKSYVMTVEVDVHGKTVCHKLNIDTSEGFGYASMGVGTTLSELAKHNTSFTEQQKDALLKDGETFLGTKICISLSPTKDEKLLGCKIKFYHSEINGFIESSDKSPMTVSTGIMEINTFCHVKLGETVTMGGLTREEITSDGQRKKTTSSIKFTLTEK